VKSCEAWMRAPVPDWGPTTTAGRPAVARRSVLALEPHVAHDGVSGPCVARSRVSTSLEAQLWVSRYLQPTTGEECEAVIGEAVGLSSNMMFKSSGGGGGLRGEAKGKVDSSKMT
jgi:hypothetical protein